MDEEIDKSRGDRILIFNIKHIYEKIFNEKLFSSIEKGDNMIKGAIKRFGVLVKPLFGDRNDCHYVCLFKSDLNKIVGCPIIIKANNVYYIPTIYPANDWQKKAYKEIINKKYRK